jgi:hypothetical protein
VRRKLTSAAVTTLLAFVGFGGTAVAHKHDGGNPGGSNKHCKGHCH